jgi:hypothetical protein
MFNAQLPGHASLNGAGMIHRLREKELIEAADQESNEIVQRTADRVVEMTDAAVRELAALEAQVAATIGAAASSGDEAFGSGPGSRLLRPVPCISPEALQSLRAARCSLEALLKQIGTQPRARFSLFRVRTRTALSAASGIILVAAGLGMATGWLSAANPTSPETGSGESIVATAGRGGDVAPDDLRSSAEAWLRVYFETGTPPGVNHGAAIRDERQPDERVGTRAARRVIAPARIDVFGDAAVLTTSITEHPEATPDREVTSLVAQLWTRAGGQWHLDDVRIVSAVGAEHAFRR